MDIQESRDVTEVKQTDVAEVDRFLVKQIRRNHSHSDHVPRRPGGLPVGNGGDREGVQGSNSAGRPEEGGRERWPLEEPKRITRGGVHSALDGTKVCRCEQGEGVLFAEMLQTVSCRKHSIHQRVLHSRFSSAISEPRARSRIESLFPETIVRGIVIDSAPFIGGRV